MIKHFVKKPTAPLADAMQFPDGGISQHGVAKWVESKGGKLRLFDGMVKTNIEASDGSKWQWTSGSLDGVGHVNIGDWIICDNGDLIVFNGDDLKTKYKEISI